MSIFYYAFCLVSVNQWDGYGDVDCTAEEQQMSPTGQCAFADGDRQAPPFFSVRRI